MSEFMESITPPVRSQQSLTAADLFCFSHLRWNFVYQRPQHLLSRASQVFGRVHFIEEPVFEDTQLPRLETREIGARLTLVVPVLPDRLRSEQAEAQAEMLEPLLSNARRPLVFWYYTPMALEFTGRFTPDLCIYDNMDELAAFAGAPPLLKQLEEELLSRADIVFTGGWSLYEAKRRRHSNVYAFPSSVDVAHFRRARDPARQDPPDQAELARPRVGYFGVIDERMDLGLVAAIAELRPSWQFLMIGPVAKIDPATLPRRENILWLGGKAYEELPAYLGGWDVGIMPFAINAATRFISPTKTPEFLAAGVPVVSTPIADVVRDYGRKGLVEIAGTAGEMVEKIEMLLGRSNGTWSRRVERHLGQMSWDRTWAEMQDLIADGLRREPGPGSTLDSSVMDEALLHV